MILPNSGNVGIGTTSPSGKLSVHDSSGSAGTNSIFTIASSSSSGTGTTTLFTVLGNGKVGIGTTSPVANLSVNGNAYITSNVAVGTRGSGFNTDQGGSIELKTASTTATPFIDFGLSGSDFDFRQVFDPAAYGGSLYFRSSTTNSILTMRGNGNVGIGTTTPATLLNVFASGNVASVMQIDTSGTQSAQQSALQLVTLSDAQNLGTSGNRGWQITGRGNAYSTATEQNDLGFFYWNGSSYISPLSIDSGTGNIGIGTTTPSDELTVKGNDDSQVRIESTSNFASIFFGSDGGSDKDLLIHYGGNGTIDNQLRFGRYANGGGAWEANPYVFDMDAPGNTFVATVSGYVGIGTSSPASVLSVTGTDNTAIFRVSNSNNSRYIELDGNEINQYNDVLFLNHDNANNVIMVDGGGNVGVNTASPNDGKVEVKGGTVCVDTNSNDSAASCIASESDERLKTNIRALSAEDSLNTLLALNPVSYDWRYNDPEILSHYPLISRFAENPHSIGLIAQEVQPLLPEAISTETVGDDIVQYFQLDYDKFIPIIIGAFKDLHAMVIERFAAQDANNESQAAAIDALERRIIELEARDEITIPQPEPEEGEANNNGTTAPQPLEVIEDAGESDEASTTTTDTLSSGGDDSSQDPDTPPTSTQPSVPEQTEVLQELEDRTLENTADTE